MKKLLSALLLLSSSAFAVDGVFEINQLCATSLGCFSGDTGGFPITISSPGSYRLTGNLDVSGLIDPEDVSAIVVTASNVTIDMNGFQIRGPVFCTGTTVTSCAPSGGTGIGIDVTAVINTNSVTRVKNGAIRGMGAEAINIQSDADVIGMTINSNGGAGIVVVGRGIVADNNLIRNGGEGIIGGSLISRNNIRGNAATGITPLGDSKVYDNRIDRNGDDGVDCSACSLIENVITNNSGFGVTFSGTVVSGGNLIDGNTMGEITGAVPFEIAPNRCGAVAC